MAVEFKVYVPKESTLVELGTVAKQIPGGSLKFCPGTIGRYQSGTTKSMAMVLLNKQGESATLPLSKAVSATIKKALENGSTKKECLAAILKLEVRENADGIITIGAPRGLNGEEEELTVSNAVKIVTTYEDLAF